MVISSKGNYSSFSKMPQDLMDDKSSCSDKVNEVVLIQEEKDVTGTLRMNSTPTPIQTPKIVDKSN